jgi:hypothetical protein
MVVDQYTDPDKILHSLVDAQLQPRAALPAHKLASPVHGLFPIDNRQDAALSLAYATCQWDKLDDETREKIAMAAVVWDISDELADAAAQLWDDHAQGLIQRRELEKRASAPAVFAVPEHGRLPLDTPAQTRKSCHSYDAVTANLPYTQKVAAAAHIVIAVAQHGLPASEIYQSQKLAAYGGMASCDLTKLIEACATRAGLAGTLGGGFAKMAAQVDGLRQSRGAVITDERELIKTAQLLSEMDELAGLSKWYGTSIEDPYLTVFNNTKVAAESCATIAGKPAPYSKLRALSAAELSDAVGPDFASAVMPGGSFDPQTFEQMAPTLPRDQQVALAQMLGL